MIKPRKCPKCGDLPNAYQTPFGNMCSLIYDAEPDGYVYDLVGTYYNNSKINEEDCVIALCMCGHKWKLRGVRNISELCAE